MIEDNENMHEDGSKRAVLDYARPDTLPTFAVAVQWSMIPVLMIACTGLIVVSGLVGFQAGGRLGAFAALVLGLLTPGNCAAAIAEHIRGPKPWYVWLCLVFNVLATVAALGLFVFVMVE